MSRPGDQIALAAHIIESIHADHILNAYRHLECTSIAEDIQHMLDWEQYIEAEMEAVK